MLDGASVQGRLHVTRRVAADYATPAAHDYDEELFARLRELRLQLAENERIPPYMVFGDRSLQEMAIYYPQNEASFAAIYGVGEFKMAHFAAQFIEVIQAYCAERGLAERPRPEQVDFPTHVPAVPGGTRQGRILYAVQQLERGKTVREIAATLGVRFTRVIGYLEEYMTADRHLPEAPLLASLSLPLAEQSAVFAQFDQLGIERLGPIFEALNGRIPYPELRLLRLCYRLRMRAGQRLEQAQA